MDVAVEGVVETTWELVGGKLVEGSSAKVQALKLLKDAPMVEVEIPDGRNQSEEMLELMRRVVTTLYT